MENIKFNLSEFVAWLGDWSGELLITDVLNDGTRNSNLDMLKVVSNYLNNYNLILRGGLSETSEIQTLLSIENVKAVAIGNQLGRRENSLFELSDKLKNIRKRQMHEHDTV
jgi:phosphoribosylformimino-5-aminoimidazole carboxamide ribonucleotide (ProFAR) isomerase